MVVKGRGSGSETWIELRCYHWQLGHAACSPDSRKEAGQGSFGFNPTESLRLRKSHLLPHGAGSCR